MKEINPKKSVYLFSDEFPAGEMFNLTPEQLEGKLADGWVDSPERLYLPENMDAGVTEAQVKNMRPEDLVKFVESYGFIVLTKEQLQAEANKMASVALDIAKFSDDALIAEAEKRGLKDPQSDNDELLARFNEDPKSLTKEELIILGSEYKLGLRMNFSEQTMIDKIKEALEAQGEE